MPTFGFNNASTSRDGFDVDLFDLGGGNASAASERTPRTSTGASSSWTPRTRRGSRSPARCSRRRFATRTSAASPCSCARTSKTSPGAKTVAEVAEALGLATLQNDRHRVVPCVAAREDARAEPDASVDVGMRWMMERVGEDWDELNPRGRRGGGVP